MTIADYGGPTDTLASPSLSVWAGAVADTLTDHDIDIDTLETTTAGMGGWTAYVPTVTNAVMSSVTAEYTKTGRTVTMSVKATVTSVSGLITFSPPVEAATTVTAAGVGTVRMVCAGNIYWGFVNLGGTLSLTLHTAGVGGLNANTSASSPATWASGNSLAFTATYKSAT